MSNKGVTLSTKEINKLRDQGEDVNAPGRSPNYPHWHSGNTTMVMFSALNPKEKSFSLMYCQSGIIRGTFHSHKQHYIGKPIQVAKADHSKTHEINEIR